MRNHHGRDRQPGSLNRLHGLQNGGVHETVLRLRELEKIGPDAAVKNVVV